MQKYATLIAALIKLGLSIVKAIAIEKSAASEADKRAQVLALVGADVPVVAAMVGAPAEAFAAFATPELLGALYDGGELVAHEVQQLEHPAAPAA